jgi:transmembrane sensor
MAQRDQDRLTEAIQWRIRLRDGGPDDWDAFVRWLEEDPERSAVYDAVADAERAVQPDMIAAATSFPAANDEAMAGPIGRPRRAVYAWAAALSAVAALVLFVFALPWFTAEPGRYAVATAAGEQRTVEIGPGSSIALNGATRVVLDRDDPRYAELAAGEALFTIRHDAAHPFTVVAGDHRVQDVGTVFNLTRDGGTFTVGVAEGAVIYEPGGAAISLGAGETLAVDEAHRRIVRDRQDPAAIAGWRRGQLSFKHAPLAAVARGLSRSIGMDIRLDPAIADRPFTGTVRIDGDPSATMARFAATLDLKARRDGAGWLIEPSPRARR